VRRAGLPAAVRPGAGGRQLSAVPALTRHSPTTEEGEVAERNRPGDDAADDRPDGEVFDDAVADDAVPDDEPVTRGSGSTSTLERKADADDPKAKKDVRRAGFFGRIGGFFREVVAELRKVIWPTRKELLTYTAVVISFLVIMTTIVVLLDYGFAKAVLWAFGSGK
jgi:preprotein translocase subunit SecE